MRTLAIDNSKQIEEIIKACKICFLGLSDQNNQPYVIPMNFGYHNNIIYLHSGQFGRKWEIMKMNPKACVTFNVGENIKYQDEQVACSWRMQSKSVVATGNIEFINNIDEKEEILHIFMKQYSDKAFKFNTPAVKNVGVMRMKIESITAKEFGAKAPTAWG